MITKSIFNIRKASALGLGLAAMAIVFASCNGDDLDGDSYYTFKGETVSTYLENRPDSFSVFFQIVKDAGQEALLSTYGHYTAFVPTDEAFNTYLAEKGMTYEDLSSELKRDMVFNHIIRGSKDNYLSRHFAEGALPEVCMNNRYMVIRIDTTGGHRTYFVNKASAIVKSDVELHNGVVHVIDKVIVPSDETLGSLLELQPRYKLFSEAFSTTHLCDSMLEAYDMSYKPLFTTEFQNIWGHSMKTPQQKKLGYTIFAEPDEVFHAAGIKTIDQLTAFARTYYGNEAADDPTDRRNALNRFVSYHLLNRQMPTNELIYSGGCTTASYMDKRYEYYETMLQYRLIEVKAGNKINTLSDGTCVSLNEAESNINGLNGYIHCLNDILVYDETKMVNDVLNKRIRVDAFSLAPQLTNNNIRWKLVGLNGYGYTISPDFCGDYFRFSEETAVKMWASEDWTNYQADEMSIRGWYDFTVRMLPVPPGTYEIRLGYSVRDWGGLAQIFIDGKIVGIPVDFVTKASDPKIGWVDDSETTDNGTENDKLMRNRGYMKGPASVYKPNYYVTLRQQNGAVRKILDTRTFQDYAPHYLRAKNIQSEGGEFQFDYIEYIPVGLISTEDKD